MKKKEVRTRFYFRQHDKIVGEGKDEIFCYFNSDRYGKIRIPHVDSGENRTFPKKGVPVRDAHGNTLSHVPFSEVRGWAMNKASITLGEPEVVHETDPVS